MVSSLRAAVLGTTGWGVTLSLVLARNGHEVTLLARTEDEAAKLSHDRRSSRVPGQRFPANMSVTWDAERALRGADLLVLAVPAQSMRVNVRTIANHIPGNTVVVGAAKGIERGDGKRMSEVVLEEAPSLDARRYCALSGPNLAREIARGLPAATVIASESQETAQVAQDAFSSLAFRVYTSNDVTGVELGGALKNVIAISAGAADGLRLGENAKAGIVARGLAEITRLGVACGAEALTFLGLGGVGDLMVTCYSRQSRNRYVGEELGKGRKLEDVLKGMSEVAEGVETTAAAWALAQRLSVYMPVTESVYRVVHEGMSVTDAVRIIVERRATFELQM